MAIDASQVLGSPQLAATKVMPRGSAWRQANRQSYSLLAGLVAPLAARIVFGHRPDTAPAQTPKFGQVAWLAVSRDELALVNLARKPTGALARIPLDQVETFDLQRARMVWPLTITCRNGDTWRLEIPLFSKKAAKAVAAVVSGQQQHDQRTSQPASGT